MIETEIKKLTEAIEGLCALLREQAKPVTVQVNTAALPKKDAPGKTKTEPDPILETKPEETPEPEAINRQALQDMCLKKVRDDGSKRPKIKALIKTFGADLLTEIPDDKLAEFQAKLEAI